MIYKQSDINEVNLRKEIKEIKQRINIKNLEEALYFPKFFQIETTRLCNSRCKFCAVDQWDKSTPFMSDELFQKIVDEMSKYTNWIEVVMVQRAGEPLMDKKIVNRVKKLKDIGLKRVSMSSNVYFLDEQKARDLINVGLDEIMFSIDAIDKERYENLRKGIKYETVINNIENFFKIREEMKAKIDVRVRGVSFHKMNDKDDLKDLARWEAFWNRFKKPTDRIYMKHAHNWGNQKKWDNNIPENDWVYHPCVLPWSTMHVTAMGIVPLCPQDYDAKANIGNVNQNTIKEIWNNSNWNRIRELHKTGKRNEISFCQGCRLFDLDYHMENWQQKQLYEG